MVAGEIISRITLLFFFSIITFITVAQVKMPAIFSDNMILQRRYATPIWGKASPGEKVSVSFAGQKLQTQADSAGNWKVALTSLKASFEPNELIVSASNNITLKNILVGDVWLCTGQSNMEYPIDRKWKKYAGPKKGNDVAEEEFVKAGKPDGIRYLYVERTLSKIPELPTKGWANGNDTILKYVSAIGYFFAKEIYEETNVPIGIISSSWGGTRIEQWTPDWAYQQSKIFKDSVTSPNYKIDGMHPGQMYKGMIEPLIPFSIKGILWYQGESNCMIEDQATYSEKYKIFAGAWRNLFKDNELPIYTVQISPFLYTSRKDPKKHSAGLLPKFWEAQAKCQATPNTEMAVTTDLVDNLSEIHPSYKWIVGHRLALTALAKSYGKVSVVYSGPVYRSAKRKKESMELSFSNTGSGLSSRDDKPLTWFTIAGKDGKFVQASAIIEGNKLSVLSPAVKRPKYVRFAWDETAQPNFINKEGLPALPFRTDDLKMD